MIKINNIPVESHLFPNGETYIDLPNEILTTIRATGAYYVSMEFKSTQDIWDLIQITERLHETGEKVHLIMSYVPFSRMDRKENDRLFSLKSFTNIINGLNFDSVTIDEPHSDVTPALLEKVKVRNMTKILVRKAVEDLRKNRTKGNICLVYPDAGAEKRYSKQFNHPHVITISKSRDFDTGWLKIKHLMGVEENQDCEAAIIVDDLCSRGGTFKMAAEELRAQLPNLKKVILCVAHCENTIFDGDLLKTDLIDAIYTTNSIIDVDRAKDTKIKVFGYDVY